MNEYSTDIKLLRYLRKHTILTPIELLMIDKYRVEAEEIQKWYHNMEKAKIGIDYSAAEKVELELRLNHFEKRCINLWQEYGKIKSLQEFTLKILEDAIAEETIKKSKKKTKKWI